MRKQATSLPSASRRAAKPAPRRKGSYRVMTSAGQVGQRRFAMSGASGESWKSAAAQVQFDVVDDGLAGENVVLAVVAHGIEQRRRSGRTRARQEDLGARRKSPRSRARRFTAAVRLPSGRVAHEHDALGIGVVDERAGEQLPRHGAAVLAKRGGKRCSGCVRWSTAMTRRSSFSAVRMQASLQNSTSPLAQPPP